MADQTYVYHGPASGVTLVHEDGNSREVMLYDGRPVSLPADHPHVITLVAQRILEPVQEPATPTVDPAAELGRSELELQDSASTSRTPRNKERP